MILWALLFGFVVCLVAVLFFGSLLYLYGDPPDRRVVW
jgi:Na+-driven multidrug efflux pump